MRILLPVLLSIALVACGDDDELPGNDAGNTPDASADGGTTPDVGPGPDAAPGPDAGTDAGTDAAPGPDAGTDAGADAGPMSTAVQDFIDALTVTEEVYCACDTGGYTSAELCVGVSAIDDAYDTCYRGAVEEAIGDADVLEFVECFATAQAELTTCITAAGCDDEEATDVCDDAFIDTFSTCTELDFFDTLQLISDSAIMCATTDAMTCPDGEASSATGTAVFTGNTVGGANNYDDGGECTYSTPERTHVWTAPSAGTFTFDTAGSGYDTNLALFADCEESESLECNDDGIEDTLYSSITRTFEADESVVVVVEGYDGTAGAYVINVTEEVVDPK